MRRFCIFFSLVCCCLGLSAQKNATDAKPCVFWHWVQAGVSKPGITADLEAMKANGIGGAYLLTIKGENSSNPPLYQPASQQLTPQWWDMVKFAFNEAKRLDLKIGMHFSDGFSLAGGPWITPENSMQKVVSAKFQVRGGSKLKIKLPQPLTNEGYYKDIAIYAYPSPVGTGISTQTVIPKVTTSNGMDASGLVKNDNKQNFSTGDSCWIQYEFAEPFTCRSINIKTSGNNYQSNRLAIEVSNDGKIFKKLGRLEAPRHGWQDTSEDFTHAIFPTTAKYFRFIYNKAGSEPGSEDLDAAKWKQSLKILKLELSAEARILHYEGKNGSVWRISSRTNSYTVPSQLAVPLHQIINITDKVAADGSLNWEAPKGSWTILRIGHTSTGQKNATGGGGIGLEADKFNPEVIKLQFDKWYGEALRQGGPDIAGKVLNTLLVESWEAGSQNWSPVFKAEFLKRRGYDPTPYLPIMTGLPVQSIDVSENFLYDVRKTIAELIADQFFGTVAKLAKENGVMLKAESVAPTMMSDGLLHYKHVDVAMGEFWNNSPTHDKPNDMLDAISGAHIYGKNIVEAESFTTVRMDWNESPANLKTLLDRNYALGLNKVAYHVFVHNPWMDRKPGMTLDGVGIYFQRDQTWWKQGKAFVDYATRVQNLLQQGRPVVDVAVFTGDELPRRAVLPDRLVAALPGIFGPKVVETERKRLANVGEPLRQIPSGVTHTAGMADPENWVNPLKGYNYDSFNPDVLLTATVNNGDVVFASGASYKVLIVPGRTALNPNYAYMSFSTVKKLLDLVKVGATIIVADQPLQQNGIKQNNRAEFDKIVNQIWGGKFTQAQTGNSPIHFKQLGLGSIYKAPFYDADFRKLGIRRDLIVSEKNKADEGYAANVTFTHRKDGEKEIYFISNQENTERELTFTFRDKAKTARIYDPVNDIFIKLNNIQSSADETFFTYKLAPHQSIVVLFNEKDGYTLERSGVNWSTYQTVQDLSTNWRVKFDPNLGGPASQADFPSLTDWTVNIDSNIKYYSGTANYTKTFNYKATGKEKVWLNLGQFSSIAEVKLNGVDLGTVWTPPFRVDLSESLKVGENKLEVSVTNTWGNRLIGDSHLPVDKRITKTTAPFRLAGKPLYPAGLLGPVTIEIEGK